MTAPVQTSAGVTPGPYCAWTPGTVAAYAITGPSAANSMAARDAIDAWQGFASGDYCVVAAACQRTPFLALGNSKAEAVANAQWAVDAMAAQVKTGKTTSELAAEVERLAKDRDALLGALRLFQKAGFGNSTDFHAQAQAFEAYHAALAAISQCEGAKA